MAIVRSIPNALVRVNTDTDPSRLRQQLGAPLATIQNTPAIANALQTNAMQQQISALRGQVSTLANGLSAQQQLFERLVGRGGQFFSGSRDANISPYVVPGTPGKGGILPTEAQEFGDETVTAGSTYTMQIPSWARARLTGTSIEGITAQGFGTFTRNVATAFEFSLYVNGISVVEANRVPLDQVFGTIAGDQILPQNIYVGADVEVTAQLTALMDVTFGDDGAVFLRFWCGNGDSYALRVR